MSWFNELFINEAKQALNKYGSGSSSGNDETIATKEYVDELIKANTIDTESLATKDYVEELIEANAIDTENIATKTYVEELIGGIENGSY